MKAAIFTSCCQRTPHHHTVLRSIMRCDQKSHSPAANAQNIVPKIIVLLLIVVGAGLFWHGFQVRDSLKGKAQQVSSDIQKSWSGDAKITDATWFMVGGGVLIFVGAAAVVRK